MSCENCGHLSYELAGCQYELGITTSERDILRQQLAERDAEIERGAIERSELRKQIAERDMDILAKDIAEIKALGDRNKAREQRDKLAGLLLDARHFCQRAPSLLPKIDAALAEVNK